MFNIPAEADLDASVEMIAFMWVAIGNDTSAVTPEALSIVRRLLAQDFALLPPELQTLFANGQANNSAVQAAWNAADPLVKTVMAQQFQQLLVVLGLVPDAGGGQSGDAAGGGQSLNAEIASNIAWNSSGAGDWSSR